MDVVTGLVVGLVAGLVTRAVTGRSAFDVLFRDLLVGVVGALLGRWIFTRFALSLPVTGQLGTVLAPAIGATGLLALLWVLRPTQRVMW